MSLPTAFSAETHGTKDFQALDSLVSSMILLYPGTTHPNVFIHHVICNINNKLILKRNF